MKVEDKELKKPRVKRETISRERIRQIQFKAFAHARKRLLAMGITKVSDVI